MDSGSRTHFILLAAGRSSRMRQDKALLDFYRRPWIQVQVEQILKSEVIDTVIIVDQPGQEALYRPLLQNFHVRFVENKDPSSDPADSIFLAFQNNSYPNGSFISPIDVPLKAADIGALWLASRKGFLCVKPSYKGKGGHPIWVHSQLIERFKVKPQRMDEFIAQLPADQIYFEEILDSRIQLNLNTPEDWQDFLTRAKEHPKS